jgi:hypothetical protein
MRYIHVQWLHSFPNEPVDLYSELDDVGWETRKLEVFRDGTVGFASRTESTGDTDLGEIPVPPLEEIAADPQFRPTLIAKEEFERLWAKRRPPVHVGLTA